MPESGLDKLCTDDLKPNPIAQFEHWLHAAELAGLPHANAMTLATADGQGQPSARIVLLRGVDERGFCFYTNYTSDKGKQLEVNQRAALVFFWPQLGRQVRIEGGVEKLSAAESDRYFASRPRGHQLSAHASRQSRVIDSRSLLEQHQRQVEERYAVLDVPRPDYWGGYRVSPRMIEFWQEGDQRLHDRLRYTGKVGSQWTIERLSP